MARGVVSSLSRGGAVCEWGAASVCGTGLQPRSVVQHRMVIAGISCGVGTEWWLCAALDVG